MTAPPTGSAAPDDHFGLILHPLFPHAHGHAGLVISDENQGSDLAVNAPFVGQSPGISASGVDSGGRDVVAGIVLPLLLAGLLMGVSRRRHSAELLPEQRTLAPPFPPPRLALRVS